MKSLHARPFCLLAGLLTLAAILDASVPARAAEPIIESARRIPIAYDVDVVVVGGGTGAVAAAVAAAQSNAKVFLAAPRPYLGEDLCATMRLWLEPGETPDTPLARALFNSTALETGNPVQTPAQSKPFGPFRPIYIKKALDDALLDAKVQFLYGCYATELLRDVRGRLCGLVMANRAGRQAVKARVIIDATDRAWVARMAGAQFPPYSASAQEFKYVVVGGAPQRGEGIVSARRTGLAYRTRKTTRDTFYTDAAGENKTDPIMISDLIEYTLSLPMADGSFASFARAEQLARNLTWNPDIQFNTDELFQVPPDPMKGVKQAGGEWAGVERLALEAFQPAGVPGMYVLGGCADLPRAQAAKLLRPLALMAMGTRIGKAAATQARMLGEAQSPAVAATAGTGRNLGEVKELLTGVRPSQRGLPTLVSPRRSLPVFGEVDVVVIGGGTGGAPAGIGAGRAKAKTLVIEYLHGLGGVGTLGLISRYSGSYIQGFTKEVPLDGRRFNPLLRAEWWRKTLQAAGGDLWFGALGCGALVENGKVKGVIVATPQGRGVVLARDVIDSTGNSDIAAAAGAQTMFVNASEPAVQGTGLPPIKPGSQYTNTDFTIVDDSDMLDTWHVQVYAKNKYAAGFDMGQLVDTRERRRIVGDFFMTLTDTLNDRTYPDTISIGRAGYDTHGMTVDPFFLLEPPGKGRTVSIPYRCLLPKGLDGILVTGLGVSAHRDAIPIIRMEPDVQNQGYAAGLIAATAAQKNQPLRQVDIPAIQKQLVAIGNLPANVAGKKDSYPLSAEQIAAAVKNPKGSQAMAVIYANTQQALPLLRQAYADAASGQDKLNYARILAVLRDPSGVDQLVAEVGRRDWDKGWKYRGGGQFGSSMSPLDMLMVGMARTGDKRCLAPVLRKAAMLNENSEFSHFRAVALALEMIGDPAGAEPLAKLLALPGVRGHMTPDPRTAFKFSGTSAGDNLTRSNSIRELTLARALYRCGDKDGLGKQILTEYTRDLRGYLAQHAQAVLDGQ